MLYYNGGKNMNKNNYSFVEQNVKSDGEDIYHYYDRTRFGKKYFIVCTKELNEQDVNAVFQIILKKERVRNHKKLFKSNFSCSESISKYIGYCCRVRETDNRTWLIEVSDKQLRR